MKCLRLYFAIAAGLVAAASFATGETVTVMVTSCSENSLLWNTVTHETETVQIEWPESAASARIETSAGQTIALNDKTRTSVDVTFGSPPDAESERVIDMTLTFFDAGGQVLSNETRTAQLGWVRGVGANSFDLRPSDTNAVSWSRTGNSGVLFLGGSPEAFQTNGVAVALESLPQRWWFETAFSASEPLRVALLDSDGTQYEQTLFGTSHGTLFIFR